MSAPLVDHDRDRTLGIPACVGVGCTWCKHSRATAPACTLAIHDGQATVSDWFPTGGITTRARSQRVYRPEKVATAMAVCAACPVREACLEQALRMEDGEPVAVRSGVWGGTTPVQRLDIATGRGGQPKTRAQREAERGEIEHGTRRGYVSYGCRCPSCTEAKNAAAADSIKRARAKGLEPEDPRHGTTSAYSYWGCRCTRCVAKKLESVRDYEARKRLGA